jgi:hypothetical protein
MMHARGRPDRTCSAERHPRHRSHPALLCGRHGELSFEQPRHMQCFPLRTIVNLVPATGAIGYNDGSGHLAHRRQQADLCHLHGYVVMSCFIAENSGHSTTRAFYQFRPRSRDESQHVEDGVYRAEGFLMAMAMQ